MENKSEQALMTVFNRNPIAAKAAVAAIKNYSYTGIENILLIMHHYNLRSIGIGDAGTDDADLMKEMVVKMMNPV
jgi:DNA polymerase-3 subunit delta